MALRMLSRVSGLLQPARQSLATDTSRLGIAIRPFSAAAQAAEQPSGEKAKSSGQGWGHTRILDILRSKVYHDGSWLWCSKDDTVFDAVKKMTKGNVGSLLVFDPSKFTFSGSEENLKVAAKEAVAGLVTERDYLTKVVVAGKSSKEIKVSTIMTPEHVLKTVAPTDTVLAAMELMIDNNFRHVPVVDDGDYLGMVSIRDAVRTMVAEHREEVDKLHEYIQGGY